MYNAKDQQKTILGILSANLIDILGILAFRYDQLLNIDPDPDWEKPIASLDITHEHILVQRGNVELEAELLIPTGGKEKKAVLRFAGGSGQWIYQAYPDGFIVEYIPGVLLPRDMAVLLINKRGLGKSEGNWMHNDIQGRADDLYAAVQKLKSHLSMDPDRIGLIGHSQVGWVVVLAAVQHDDVDFIISLAGPTTPVFEEMEADQHNYLCCQGYNEQALASKFERDRQMDQIGAALGKAISLCSVLLNRCAVCMKIIG